MIASLRSQDKIDAEVRAFSEVLAVEMEGALLKPHWCQKPFIVVRAIGIGCSADNYL